MSASALDHAPTIANEGRPIRIGERHAATPYELDIALQRGGARVTGVVLDTTGGPVVGAEVKALFTSGSAIGSSLINQRATTDEQGQFTLSCLPGSLRLTALADGYAPVSVIRYAPAGDVELVVTPAASIRGRVVSDDGEPVEGVRVRAERDRVMGQESLSASDGSFELGGLAPGIYQLRASGAGFLGDYPETVLLDLGERADDILITVIASAMVRGRLIGSDEKPCAEGEVLLTPTVRDHSLPALSAIADGDGDALFEAVPKGTYQVSFGCDGDYQQAQLLEVGERGVADLTWRLQRRPTIAGKVIDRSGAPVPRFNLSLSAHAAGPVARAQSDADGKFSFAGISPGSYTIVGDELSKPVRVTLAQRSQTDLTVIADAVGRIEVEVRSASGEPVDQLSVYALLDKGLPSAPGEPKGDGRYDLGPLPAGSYPVILDDGLNPVVRAGGASATSEVIAGRTTRVQARLPGHGGRIVGVVRDGAGDPVANVWVKALGASTGELDPSLRQLQQVDEGARRRLTDSDGSFELEGLAEEGSFTITAERPLGGEARRTDVQAGARVELVLEAPGSVAGVAVDARGEPVDHLMLQLRNVATGQQRSEISFDPEGRWKLTNVTPGPIQIVVADRSRRFATASLTLAPKQQLADVRLVLVAAEPPKPPAALAGAAPATSSASATEPMPAPPPDEAPPAPPGAR